MEEKKEEKKKTTKTTKTTNTKSTTATKKKPNSQAKQKKEVKKSRSTDESLLPFLCIITLLLLVAPQRCHIHLSDNKYYIPFYSKYN